MKIICNKQMLLDGINIVQKAVSTKSSLQILEGILFDANEKLILTGNDLEIGIECIVDAKILKEGKIVISSKVMGEIVRKLPDTNVTIEVVGQDNIIIDSEEVHFEIKGMNADNFPAIQSVDKEDKIEMKKNILKDMIKKTIFAVSPDENRPILTGSLIELENNNITIVSIDGFRLSLRKEKLNQIKDLKKKVVVPGKTLSDVQKIITDDENIVSIYTTKNQIMFEMEGCKIVSRLLEGEYLNYKSIIPTEFELEVVIDKSELLLSLERAMLVIPTEERRYPVIFKVSNDKLKISVKTELGSVEEKIVIEQKGKDMEIGFNPKYFIDALRAIDEEEIKINFTSEKGPCIILSLEKEKYIQMLLPVRR